jgi:NADH:ubiquinone oxidoreductase subunit E
MILKELTGLKANANLLNIVRAALKRVNSFYSDFRHEPLPDLKDQLFQFIIGF